MGLKVGDAVRTRIASVGWRNLDASEGWGFLVRAGGEPTILDVEPDADEDERADDEPEEPMAPPSSADLPLDFQRGVIISSSYGKAWVCVIIEVTWADDARAPCMCVDRVGGPAPPLSLKPK